MDLTTGRVLREGVDLGLRPQALRALKVLIQNSGLYVDYERMIAEAWDGTVVSRHTVDVTVGEVKKSMQEFGCWIVHKSKVGYRLAKPKSDDLVRRGQHFANRRTREGLEKAAECFLQAAEEDGADFRAYEGLCASYLLLGVYGMRMPREINALFLQAYNRAVTLSGVTPELRSHRAHSLHMFERRFEEAEAEFLQALREKPGFTATYIRLAVLYSSIGNLKKAFDALAEAQKFDPLWPLLPAAEVALHFLNRDYDAAIRCGKSAIELHPFIQIGRFYYAQALEFSGRADEALREYQVTYTLSPDLHLLRALEAACLARRGRRAEALELLEEIEQLRLSDYVDAYYVALLYDALGMPDRAFQEFDRGLEESSISLCLLAVDPKMDGLKHDRRYPSLRDRVFGGGSVVPAVQPRSGVRV